MAARGTHFANGVTNVLATDELGILRTVAPNLYYSQNFDFFSYTAADWVVTETDAGSTEAIVDGAGGLLAITNVSAGATDAAQIQWAGGSGAARLTTYWDSTKDLIMTARFKVSDATNTALLIGAATVDTTVVASLPTDGIYFYKAGAAASLIASTRKSGTSSSITLGSMSDDTFCTATIAYTPSGFPGDNTGQLWRAWFNTNLVGSISTTTNSPTNGLCTSIGLLNASAAAHVLTVDYLSIMVARSV